MRGRWSLPIVILALSIVGCSDSGGETAESAEASPTTGTAARPVESIPVALPTVAVDDDDQGIGPPRSDELGPPGMPRPCLMVSFDELEAVSGAVAVRSEEGFFQRVLTCFVLDAADEKLMSLALGPPEGFDEAAGAADAQPLDDVAGLDGAVVSDGVLHVLHENEHVAVKLYPGAGVGDAASIEALQTLAAGALSRYIPPPPDAEP